MKLIKYLLIFFSVAVLSCQSPVTKTELPAEDPDKIEADILRITDSLSAIDSSKAKLQKPQIWTSSPYIDSMKNSFDSCFKISLSLRGSQGNDFDFVQQKGRYYYKLAGEYFVKIEELVYKNKTEFTQPKYEVIAKALNFYKDLFDEKNVMGHYDYSAELNFINDNIQEWPNKESQIEIDYNEHNERYFIGRQTTISIGIPKNGTWCIMKSKGAKSFQIEGYIPSQNTYGKFTILEEDLPLYLGDEKKFTISNLDFEKSLELLVQPCHVEKKAN